MSIILLLLAAFLPASAAFYTALKKHVPVYALVAVFFATAASLFPVLALQYLVHTVFVFDRGISRQSEMVQLLFNSFITAALTEEAVKAVCFCLVAAVLFKRRDSIVRKQNITTKNTESISKETEPQNDCFDSYRMVILAVCLGFTFGGFENIPYSLRYSNAQFLRFFTASMLHGMLGSFYAAMTQAETTRKAALILTAAVILHGLYNFFISLGGGFIVPAAAVLGIAVISAKRITYTTKQGGRQEQNTVFP